MCISVQVILRYSPILLIINKIMYDVKNVENVDYQLLTQLA